MADPGAGVPWSDISHRLESRFGLYFEPRRWPDLERCLSLAAARLGLRDARACADCILSGRLREDGWQVLVECLAVGETYFFRDAAAFDHLASRVLEPLIAARRQSTRHLRLWSAACSTGEEAWSLAMLVADMLPDWRDWNISILASDINSSALQKARAGRYGKWSMRSGMPPPAGNWLHARASGQVEVKPDLRALVRFERLNLAGNDYPSIATQTLSMDLVLCRNVLMYFEPARARAVLARLGGALVPGGWLVTGAVELPHQGVPGLELASTGELTALRRGDAAPSPIAPRLRSADRSTAMQRQGTRPIAPTLAPPGASVAASPESASLVRQARAHADAGDLPRAEQLCRQAIEQDKLDSAASHLLATILHERGAIDEAMAALQRTLYLDPGHVLARFALGSLALRHGQPQAGRRHLAHALARLASCARDEPLQGSGGLTAGELEGFIRHAEARR